LTKKMS